MTKFLFSEDQFSPSILYPLQFRYKKNADTFIKLLHHPIRVVMNAPMRTSVGC